MLTSDLHNDPIHLLLEGSVIYNFVTEHKTVMDSIWKIWSQLINHCFDSNLVFTDMLL